MQSEPVRIAALFMTGGPMDQRKAFSVVRFGDELVMKEMDVDPGEIAEDMNSLIWLAIKALFWPITLTVWTYRTYGRGRR